MMSKEQADLEAFSIKSRDGRSLQVTQQVDRWGHPVAVLDIFSVDMERQATVKLDFKMLNLLKTHLQVRQDYMLEAMCDY